ncbi:MAG: Crp/Fnr family transcriptional regulator, partial [Ralstonia sp.]|nr:Crp/Fnr family transcriptional regulator [Ralstonia sp.]MBA4295232.1 Crp/Fnr family transcriptional regulator [Ralstonia sp.]
MQDPLNVGDLLKHSPLFLDFDND